MLSMIRPSFCVAFLAACAAPSKRADQPVKQAEPPDLHVFVISIDGLKPQSYLSPDDHWLKVPNLRQLRQGGAYSKGMTAVFPSVTYPSHTSMVTGVNPAVHGIHSNLTRDPKRDNKEGWFWYAADIKVPTIWRAAHEAGRRTALINWPVTLGAQADIVVPEYWRSRKDDDYKLRRAISTPGLFDQVAAKFPDFREDFALSKVHSAPAFDIGIHLIETEPPELMFLHVLPVDTAQHRHGPWSPEATEKIENADKQIGRLIAAIKKAGIWEKSVVLVVSDHGFTPVQIRFRPAFVLRRLGLIPADETENLSDWKASVRANGGMAYIYVKDENDEAVKKLLVDTFTAMIEKKGSGVARVFTREQVLARGGDPEAFLALEAADGFRFSSDYGGDEYTDQGKKGYHGYDPEREDMKASLLVYGPRVAPGIIENAHVIDLAPTIAKWLGIPFPGAHGRALDIPLKTE